MENIPQLLTAIVISLIKLPKTVWNPALTPVSRSNRSDAAFEPMFCSALCSSRGSSQEDDRKTAEGTLECARWKWACFPWRFLRKSLILPLRSYLDPLNDPQTCCDEWWRVVSKKLSRPGQLSRSSEDFTMYAAPEWWLRRDLLPKDNTVKPCYKFYPKEHLIAQTWKNSDISDEPCRTHLCTLYLYSILSADWTHLWSLHIEGLR